MEATFRMSFSLWAGEDTSQTDPVTTKPLLRHSSKHLLSSASFLEQVCTMAPNPAKSSTMACLNTDSNKNEIFTKVKLCLEERKKVRKNKDDPMPRVPPVTRAVIPFRDHLGLLILLSAAAIWLRIGNPNLSPRSTSSLHLIHIHGPIRFSQFKGIGRVASPIHDYNNSLPRKMKFVTKKRV